MPARHISTKAGAFPFLGAGVIFKEDLSVRGLTTAASIWITPAIGIMIGVGFYTPAVLATVLTLGALSAFRWIEATLPSHSYAHHHIRFNRDEVMPESEIREFLARHGFSIVKMSNRITDDGCSFEYHMVIRTTHAANAAKLVEELCKMTRVRSFRVSPAGD